MSNFLADLTRNDFYAKEIEKAASSDVEIDNAISSLSSDQLDILSSEFEAISKRASEMSPFEKAIVTGAEESSKEDKVVAENKKEPVKKEDEVVAENKKEPVKKEDEVVAENKKEASEDVDSDEKVEKKTEEGTDEKPESGLKSKLEELKQQVKKRDELPKKEMNDKPEASEEELEAQAYEELAQELVKEGYTLYDYVGSYVENEKYASYITEQSANLAELTELNPLKVADDLMKKIAEKLED